RARYESREVRHSGDQITEIDGLRDVRGEACGEGFRAILSTCVGGQGDRGNAAPLFRWKRAQVTEEGESIFARHADVAHEHLRSEAADGRKAGGGRIGRLHESSSVDEHGLEQIAGV